MSIIQRIKRKLHRAGCKITANEERSPALGFHVNAIKVYDSCQPFHFDKHSSRYQEYEYKI